MGSSSEIQSTGATGRPGNRRCTAELVGAPGVPTTTRLGWVLAPSYRRLSVRMKLISDQDEVGGWLVCPDHSGPTLAFIWVPGTARELQVGTICPTMNLRAACGRGEGLAIGLTINRQALACFPSCGPPDHPRLSQKVASLSSCPR